MQHCPRHTRATGDSLRHTERPHKCCGSMSGKHRQLWVGWTPVQSWLLVSCEVQLTYSPFAVQR